MKKRGASLNLNEFGDAIGLSALDKELIRQKNRIIGELKQVRLKKRASRKDLAKNNRLSPARRRVT